MQASVPTTAVDNEYELFPEGTFVGELSGAELRERDDGRADLQVSFSNTAPFSENDPDTGGRTFSGKIAVVRDGINVTDVGDFSDQDLPWAIRKAGALFGGLAEAVGAGQRDEETGQVYLDVAQLLGALQDGDFAGESAVFEVTHFSFTPDDEDDEITLDQFNRIGALS